MTAGFEISPQALPAGPDGVVLRFALRPGAPAMAAVQLLLADLEAHPPAGTLEIVPALVSILIRFDPSRTSRADLGRDLLGRARTCLKARPAPPQALRRWTIPAAFGGQNGPQLAGIAASLNLAPDAAIAQICGSDLRVLAIGFAPGQPYIGLLPEGWDLPRLDRLTPSVPAGAVVVALRQIVMFGADSATGWRQVARAAFRSFVPGRAQPMPLRAGDAIRYVPVSENEIDSLSRAPDGMGGARLEVRG